jgi:flagellar biosynthetic protein FlhB
MAEIEGQEKTEQPTSKKLEEARKKGQVAKSVEINSLVIFTSGLLLLFLAQQYLSYRLSSLSFSIFNSLDVLEISPENIQQLALNGFLFFLITILPVLGGIIIVAFISNISQVGFKFSFEALIPKMDRFNPFAGIKKVFFSSRSFVEAIKALLKLLFISLFTYYIIKDLVLASTNLVDLTVEEIVQYMISSGYSLLWKIALIYAVIAAIDLVYQRYKFKKEMMMTKQEVKEENKQSEGDPLIKSRIRRVQLQAAHKRMMQNVPKADVVITNPTHYAVAVKYEMDKSSAPVILAKGVDELAKKIKEIALNNNVPLHEDRELARSLYQTCEVGEQIPTALFQAVAQVLAYVYQLRDERKKKSIL